jgi:hypothetical protein
MTFRGVDCDTNHCLVVAKVRERLAVSKRAAKKIEMERFNVKKINEGDVKESTRLKAPGYNQKQVCSSGKLTGQYGHQ